MAEFIKFCSIWTTHFFIQGNRMGSVGMYILGQKKFCVSADLWISGDEKDFWSNS